MSDEGEKLFFTIKVEMDFRQRLRQVSEAVQDIAHSLRDDEGSYGECLEFTERRTSFLLEYLSQNDLPGRRALICQVPEFLEPLVEWTGTVLESTGEELMSAITEAVSSVRDSVPEDCLASLEDLTDQQDTDEILSILKTLSGKLTPETFAPFLPLSNLAKRVSACMNCREAAEALTELITDLPELPSTDAADADIDEGDEPGVVATHDDPQPEDESAQDTKAPEEKITEPEKSAKRVQIIIDE
jgi:hypothetical protein